MNNVKYISFKDTSSNEKIASLYINNMNDIPVRFKSLIGINIKDKVYYNGKSDNIRNLLLEIKYNYIPLFVGVEQKIGSKQDHIHLLFIPKLKFEVTKWIENNYRIKF